MQTSINDRNKILQQCTEASDLVRLFQRSSVSGTPCESGFFLVVTVFVYNFLEACKQLQRTEICSPEKHRIIWPGRIVAAHVTNLLQKKDCRSGCQRAACHVFLVFALSSQWPNRVLFERCKHLSTTEIKFFNRAPKHRTWSDFCSGGQ